MGLKDERRARLEEARIVLALHGGQPCRSSAWSEIRSAIEALLPELASLFVHDTTFDVRWGRTGDARLHTDPPLSKEVARALLRDLRAVAPAVVTETRLEIK